MVRANAKPYALVTYQPTDAPPAGLKKVAAVTYANAALVPAGVQVVTGATYSPGQTIPGNLAPLAAVQYQASDAVPAGLKRVAVVDAAAGGGAKALGAWTSASLGASAPWSRLSPDGLSWDSGQSWIQDARGSWIGVVIDNTGPNANWAFSNDGGLTFSTSGAIDGGALVRASLVYEPVDDAVYALWEGAIVTDGDFLRRYQITRTTPGNTSTAIASIATTRDATLNLQLDFQDTAGTVQYGSPQLRRVTDNPAWTRGGLLAVWSLFQTGAASNGAEVRASFRALAGYGQAADNTATNWTAPAGAGTKLITQGPKTGLGWSQLYAGATPAEAFGVTCRLGSGAHAGDLVVAYYDGVLASYRLARFAWRGAANYDWAGTVTRTTIAARSGGADPDVGYQLRTQLTSQVSHDAATDRVYVGVSTWAGDAVGGERWTLCEVDLANANAVAVAQVYVAAKALCDAAIFVTGAVYYDPTAGAVLVTYTDLSPKAALSRTYNRTVAAGAAVALYSATPVDIPCILPWRDANNKAVVLWRNFNSAAVAVPPATPTYTPPYQGYIARGTWA